MGRVMSKRAGDLTIPFFVMPDPSASDAEESIMVSGREIGFVKNKPVYKKVKIIQIMAAPLRYVLGGSVASASVADQRVPKVSATSEDKGSDEDDDDVEDASFYGEDTQMEALTLLRELPQKLKDGTLKPSPPPRPKMSSVVGKSAATVS